jgi:hypothetical protein
VIREAAVLRRSVLACVVGVGCAALLNGTGCAPSGPRPPRELARRPAPETVAAALAPIEKRIAGLTTMRAGLELRWEDPRDGESESCRGSLTFAAPDRLRLRGITGSLFTVFDLVVGERSVWLDVPREKVLVFGERADPAWEELPLSPSRLFTILLAHPCPAGDCLESARLENSPDGLRLRGDGWRLLLDPLSGLPRRFERSAPESLIVTWSGWNEAGARSPWPAEVQLQTDKDGPTVHVTFGRIREGRKVRESIFYVTPEDDREILTPIEVRSRWMALGP